MESADSHSWLLMALWLSHRSTAQLYIWTTLAVLSFDLLNFTSWLAHWHHKRIPQTAGLHRWHSRKLRLSASRVHLNHSATGDIKVMFSDEIAGVPTILTIPSSRVPPLKQPYFPTCLMYISPSISSLSSVAMASCSSFSTALSLMTGLP